MAEAAAGAPMPVEAAPEPSAAAVAKAAADVPTSNSNLSWSERVALGVPPTSPRADPAALGLLWAALPSSLLPRI